MKTVYIASILLWWLSFLFGKSHAQTVQNFSTGFTNGDIELAPDGSLWGVVNHFTVAPEHESGFEKLDMSANLVQYQTAPYKDFRNITVSPQYVFITEPDSNFIHVYAHSGQYLNKIEYVDNPGNVFSDEEDNVYVVENDLNKLVRITAQGQKTSLYADGMLHDCVALTGDGEGNLFTANKYTGQIYRWEKTSGEMYAFAQMPTGTIRSDGSQIGDMVYMNGKLYVSSVGLCAIYVIDDVGTVTLVAGAPGHQGEQNDIGNKARFMNPIGLAKSISGDTLFVSDNGKVRMITDVATAGINEYTSQQEMTIFPNPSTDFVNIRFTDDISGKMHWRLVNVEGKIIENGQTIAANSTISLAFRSNPCGTYYMQIVHPVTGKIFTQTVLLCASQITQ